MNKINKVSDDKIKSIQKELKNLPKKDSSKNMKDFIDSISIDINLAIDKGYTHEEVLNILDKNGISIKLSTLKAYLKKNDKKAEITIEEISKEKKKPVEKKTSTEDFVKPDLLDTEL